MFTSRTSKRDTSYEDIGAQLKKRQKELTKDLDSLKDQLKQTLKEVDAKVAELDKVNKLLTNL